jgi:hypothetical protein
MYLCVCARFELHTGNYTGIHSPCKANPYQCVPCLCSCMNWLQVCKLPSGTASFRCICAPCSRSCTNACTSAALTTHAAVRCARCQCILCELCMQTVCKSDALVAQSTQSRQSQTAGWPSRFSIVTNYTYANSTVIARWLCKRSRSCRATAATAARLHQQQQLFQLRRQQLTRRFHSNAGLLPLVECARTAVLASTYITIHIVHIISYYSVLLQACVERDPRIIQATTMNSVVHYEVYMYLCVN